MTQSDTITLAQELIRKASVTPDDKGCQILIAERLKILGFESENMAFGEVSNLWSRRGTEKPVLAFAGHTDVVPTGPTNNWKYPPFDATVDSGILYGRGAADMKGSLAAFITACERYTTKHPHHKGSIALLITSDEEGPAINGTVKVIEALEAREEKIDWCLVGEPSSDQELGDTIKNGRRGSLNGKLLVKGKQGHVAYPHLAKNPIHEVCSSLAKLCNQSWDMGNKFFPPTSFQITNINSGTGATNVIPDTTEILFNFRFSTEVTADQLKKRCTDIFESNKFDYEITWNESGQPFLTETGPLVDAASKAIKSVKNIEAQLSTAGGTSDGRFIAPTGAQILELGPINKTIHQIDEHVSVNDLNDLSTIYELILVDLLGP